MWVQNASRTRVAKMLCFSPLAHVDLWKLFSPISAISDLLLYGSRIAKQCEAAFHDVLGMLNHIDKSSAGLLQPKWAVAWRLPGCNVIEH